MAASLAETTWVRWFGFLVTAPAVLRAVGSPLGVAALDAAAPIGFIVFVVVVSVRILRAPVTLDRL